MRHRVETMIGLDAALGPLVRILDPRPAPQAAARPVRASANIPLSELSSRTHELPPKQQVIRIPNLPPSSVHAYEWLVEHGRLAQIETLAVFERPETHRNGRLWSPNPFLVDVVAGLEPGLALDLGCGVGREAVTLAALGWNVVAIDRLQDGLDIATNLAERVLPRGQLGRFVATRFDLDEGRLVSDDRFDLATMFFYLNRRTLAEIRDLLAPGGSLVVETFTTLHQARHGKPASPDLVLRPGELLDLVSGLHIRRFTEGWQQDRHTARLWATLD